MIHWEHLDPDVAAHNASAEPGRQVKRITSAGVLPFSVYKRRVFFLLGKEGYEHRYHESDRWSDFAGKLDPGETIVEGACREFYQETAGCLMELEEAKQRLQGGDFLLACDLHPENVHSSSVRTYLLLVPYRDYPGIFRRTKRFIQYVGGDVTCIEKDTLRWFSYAELRDLAFDTWGNDRYRKKPKIRRKFAENMRRVFSDAGLYDACLLAHSQAKGAVT